MNLVQAIVATLLFMIFAPWLNRLSLDWLASFRQWQMEDQYYRDRKAFLLLCRESWVSYSIRKGKCVQDQLQAIDDELAQLKDYYGY